MTEAFVVLIVTFFNLSMVNVDVFPFFLHDAAICQSTVEHMNDKYREAETGQSGVTKRARCLYLDEVMEL